MSGLFVGTESSKEMGREICEESKLSYHMAEAMTHRLDSILQTYLYKLCYHHLCCCN